MKFDSRLQMFMDALQTMIVEYHEEQGNIAAAPTISIDKGGRKYIRIVRADQAQRSVHCFVEVSTGNILKAAGWKSPAPHARGNIYNENMLKGVGPYGAAYLK